jgi:hypothetical protein
MAAVEYRVTWQREGKPKRARIYQTRSGAEAMLDVLLRSHPDEPPSEETWSDSDYARWERMTAPFAAMPTLEEREVGTWSEVVEAANMQTTDGLGG